MISAAEYQGNVKPTLTNESCGVATNVSEFWSGEWAESIVIGGINYL